MRLGPLFTLLTTALVELSSGTLTTHDETFQPDHILRVSAKNISVACETRYSAVINGTSPGPELRLPAGQVTWIRVYNDMLDANLTMVRMVLSSLFSSLAQRPIERCSANIFY